MKDSLLNLVDLATDFGVEGFALNYGIEVTRGPLLFFPLVQSGQTPSVMFLFTCPNQFGSGHLSVLQVRS